MSPGEEELRQAGLRVTAGRIAVLSVLDALPHADAASLHAVLVAGDSSTSIQSVHNVLADLSDAGIIRRIEPAGSAARYERRAHDNHHHLVCTSCGAIADVDCVTGQAPCLHPSETHGYSIATAEITFWGVCAACQAADASPAPASVPAPNS